MENFTSELINSCNYDICNNSSVREFKEGVFDDISLKEYHKMKGWSKTALDHVEKSMAHYFTYKQTPKESTQSLNFGAATHCKILTPNLFDSEYFVLPKLDMRKTADKELYAKLVVDNQGKQPISKDDYETIGKIKESIDLHPVASRLFIGGKPEVSHFWIDESSDQKCKCRPDYILDDSDVIVELKTCQSAKFSDFQKDIAKYRYYVQAAYFSDGVAISTGRVCEFIIVAAEVVPPYDIAIYSMVDCLEIGRRDYQSNLNKVRNYFRSYYNNENPYPGYCPDVRKMTLPGYVKMNIGDMSF